LYANYGLDSHSFKRTIYQENPWDLTGAESSPSKQAEKVESRGGWYQKLKEDTPVRRVLL
jgi:hypothetical protein